MAARLLPRSTPRNSLSLNAPIRNPYDAFNASDFDSWIGGLTSSLRNALDHDGLEDEDAVKQKSVTGALEAARGADESIVVDEGGKEDLEEEESADEGVEDSFAHVNAVSARAKGKARDPRDGPGFGNSAGAPIELPESEDEEDDGGEYEEEEEESWDESDEDLDAPGSSKSHMERARRASEGDHEDEEEDDIDLDVPELPDPWAPARTYAEDYYSGGDAPVRGGSPHNLSPRLRALSPGLRPAQAKIINVDDSDEEDQVQADHSSPIPEAQPTHADRWDWNNPPAVPWGRPATRPGHHATKESEEHLELQYPDEDEVGRVEDEYDGEGYDEYDDNEGEVEEGDLQAVKDRQKGMFVSAAEVYSDHEQEHDHDGEYDDDDDDDDDDDAEAESPQSVRYRREGSSVPVEDVYGDNNAGLFDHGAGSNSDSVSDVVEVSPPRGTSARKVAVSPMPQERGLSPEPEEEEVLANPFGLPSFSGPPPALVPSPSTAPSAALNAAPALPSAIIDNEDQGIERVDPAELEAPSTSALEARPSTSALDTLASVAAPSSPIGFSLVPAVWGPEVSTVGGTAEDDIGSSSEAEEEEEITEISGPTTHAELRAQLGPDVVLAGEGATSLFVDVDGDDGMYTDPGAPAYVPETPAMLDEVETPVSTAGDEEPAPSIAAEEGVDRDSLETSTPDAENEPVPVEDKEDDGGLYTDPGAPAPSGEDAPMGYSAASSPIAPTAPSPGYVVEEPEDESLPTSPAQTARRERVATAGAIDKSDVVVKDDDEEEGCVDEVESVVSAVEADVEEPGKGEGGEGKEQGLLPVEEENEDEDELRDDSPDQDVHEEEEVPPPVMPYIPPASARAIGEDAFGRPGMPFAPKHSTSGLFTSTHLSSGLFTPLEGSDASTSPNDQSREDSPVVVIERPHSPVVERHHGHSPTPAEENMRAAMREVEMGAHGVYVGADEDDGEDAPSPAPGRESPGYLFQERQSEVEQREPVMDSPPIPTLEEPLGVQMPPPAAAQLAPFVGVDDFADLENMPEFEGIGSQSGDADLAALDAFLAGTDSTAAASNAQLPVEVEVALPIETGITPTATIDAAPEAFSLPEEAPETAAAAAATESEPEPRTVAVSLEGNAPEVNSAAVEDDPALETDETEFRVQERKMDEEAGLAGDEETGIKRLDPKLIEEAEDPFMLMGNASTVAPGAVSSGDATPVDEDERGSSEESRPEDKDRKPDAPSVDNGLVLDQVALVQQLQPQPRDEVDSQKEHEIAAKAEPAAEAEPEPEATPKPVSKDFARDATPVAVDDSLLNSEQEQKEDANKKPVSPLPPVEKESTSQEAKAQSASRVPQEQSASQQTEIADDEDKTEVAGDEEITPSVENHDDRPRSHKRKRISNEPAQPRVTRSASSTTVNGKNGAPKSKGKGKARVEEDDGASDASSALVHGLLAPSSCAGSVSSVDTDDRRPPLVQVDAHTEFIMHQHGRPRAAPAHLPQTIAQAQAAQIQARTSIVATIDPKPPSAEASRAVLRAASEGPQSDPESPERVPTTPPMQSASAPPPSTENGASRPAPLRRIPSKNTPVTRANCRFHTISLPREGGGRAHFIVPGCSMGDAKVIKEEDIRDEGLATMADHSRMLPDVENLDLDAYLVGNLRKLVGVDLLRENEVFYLPAEEEEPSRKKRRRYARKSTLDRVRTQSGEGKGASQNRSRASTDGGSTDGGSVAGFARRAGSRSAASSVADGYSTHEEDSEAESTAPQPKATRTLSTRRGTRTSRRLNPDAAEFSPGYHEAAQEEQDQGDDIARETRKKAKAKRGAKRSRTMEDVPADVPRPKRACTNLRKSMSVNQVNGK